MDYKNLIVFLTFLASCYSIRPELTPSCYQGYYFNREALECTPCSTCGENQVVRRNCFDDQDTLCGAFPELNFLRPQSSQVSTDEFRQKFDQTVAAVTTSTEILAEREDKWFTITMVLVGILVLTCAAGVIFVLVACIVCRRKDREIIYEPTYTTACTLLRDDVPVTKIGTVEQFRLVSERES